jgi:hypothetical protein
MAMGFYRRAMAGTRSMFTLHTLTSPAYLLASEDMVGAGIRQEGQRLEKRSTLFDFQDFVYCFFQCFFG